jgi:hypothetical protein
VLRYRVGQSCLVQGVELKNGSIKVRGIADHFLREEMFTVQASRLILALVRFAGAVFFRSARR